MRTLHQILPAEQIDFINKKDVLDTIEHIYKDS